MAFRLPRINTKTASPEAAAPPAADNPPLPVMPAMKPARTRDTELMARMRRIAADKARAREAALAAEAADCKRSSRRKSTTLPGLITFETMRLQLTCTIADMSISGARLKLPASTLQTFGDLEHLPSFCTLVMRTDHLQVDCEIKWRRPDSIGVRFLGPPVAMARRARR